MHPKRRNPALTKAPDFSGLPFLFLHFFANFTLIETNHVSQLADLTQENDYSTRIHILFFAFLAFFARHKIINK
jgi:hypothetical protein